MKLSTHEKLIGTETNYRIIAEWQSFSNSNHTSPDEFTLVKFPKGYALIHEYPNEKNGFAVYMEVGGNSILETRMALGIV